MNSEEMRRRRKLYLGRRTNAGSTFAFDEMGEVKDPVATICRWANLNLDDGEIRRLVAALRGLVESDGAEDGDGFEPLAERAEVTRGHAADSGTRDREFDRMFPNRRLGPEVPTCAGIAQVWIK